MLIPIAREAFLPFLVFSFLCGVFFGIVFDVFRIRRVAFRPTRREGKGRVARLFGRSLSRVDTVLTVFEDLLFFLFVTVALILVGFKLYYGVPRWYAYGAALGGFFLWRVTGGRLVIRFAETILSLLAKLLSLFLRYLVCPVVSSVKGRLSLWHRRLEHRRALADAAKEEARILAFVASDVVFFGKDVQNPP